jgi:hypothetical protein
MIPGTLPKISLLGPNSGNDACLNGRGSLLRTGCGFKARATSTVFRARSGRHIFWTGHEKPSGQFLGLESLTWRCLNSNLGRFVCFTFIFISFGESRLLVSWCADGRCGMMCSDEDHCRSRRPGADNKDGHTGQVLGGRTIERSGGTVCGLHRARGDEERGFLS